MKRYGTFTAKVGDRVIVCEDGHPYALTVWQVLPAGTAGRSYAAGSVVYAHTRPGGYGCTWDAQSALAEFVFLADEGN